MIVSITNMAASISLELIVLFLFSHVVICWTRVSGSLIGSLRNDNRFSLELLMPGVIPSQNDQYMCTARKLDSKEAYIMSFQPQATNNNAHHMLLFGCKEDNPKATVGSWECSLSKDVCRNGLKILYAWTKNALPTNLPQDVGVRVGGLSDINYLILQVHYAHSLTGQKDYTGFNLLLSLQRPKYIAGIYLLMANNAAIPPNVEKFNADSACRFTSQIPIYPFAYRVHTHSLGVVVSSYMYDSTGRWILLGKGNPQWPQAFYPMDQIKQVQNNDILSARCTYNSIGRPRTTYIGHRTTDEMCNFYIMYYTDALKGLPFYECSDVTIRSDLLNTLPKGNDMPLPPNPALEEHGKEHLNIQDKENIRQKMNFDQFDLKDRNVNQLLDNFNDYINGDDYNDFYVTHQRSKNRNKKKNYRERYGYDDEDYGDVDSVGTIADLEQDRPSDTNWLDLSNPSLLGFGSDKDSTNYLLDQQRHYKNANGNDNGNSNLGDGQKDSDSIGTSLSLSSFASTSNQTNLKSTAPFLNSVPKILNEVENWPSSDVTLGQVSGVTVDSKGNVHVFHRGNREWGASTFDMQNNFLPINEGAIKTDTIIMFDQNSGSVLKKWGSNLFYLPHGIALDKEDNIYLTDVGSHQVFKFPIGGSTAPLLTLGEKLVPGSDKSHFCKPASVVVSSSGEIFVADGYCNSRIIKFSPQGEFLTEWGKASLSIDKVTNFPPPSTFSIPHSLALAEDKNLICVADRENGRIQCFNLNGTFHCQIHFPHFGSELFAVAYNPQSGGSLYAVNGNLYDRNGPKIQGFIIDIDSRTLNATFGPSKKDFVKPHDLHVSPDGSSVYVAEIGPNKVWKLKRNDTFVSMKKSMASDPAIQQGKPGTAVDSVVDIKKTVKDEKNGKDDEEPNFGASMIIMALLAIPLLLMIIITVFVRLHKQGRFGNCNIAHFKGWMTGYKTPTPNKFNLGTFLNRHKGFDKISTEESDHDPEDFSDSDVEEYSAASVQKA